MCERYTLTPARRFNVARGQTAPIETKDGVRDARWGQLAPWRGHGGKRGPNIYELDAAAVKPKAKRCLVLADGFYAWRKLGAKKQPYWIHGTAAVAFAGVLATHMDDGVQSFAIVTVPAVGVTLAVTERMPAIVDARWLDGGEPMLLPLDGWRADAVGTHVNDVAHDDEQCVRPLGNPRQGELF